jgi:hypothetical protein
MASCPGWELRRQASVCPSSPNLLLPSRPWLILVCKRLVHQRESVAGKSLKPQGSPKKSVFLAEVSWLLFNGQGLRGDESSHLLPGAPCLSKASLRLCYVHVCVCVCVCVCVVWNMFGV